MQWQQSQLLLLLHSCACRCWCSRWQMSELVGRRWAGQDSDLERNMDREEIKTVGKTAAVWENMTYCNIQYYYTCCQHNLAQISVTISPIIPFFCPSSVLPFIFIKIFPFFRHRKAWGDYFLQKCRVNTAEHVRWTKAAQQIWGRTFYNIYLTAEQRLNEDLTGFLERT